MGVRIDYGSQSISKLEAGMSIGMTSMAESVVCSIWSCLIGIVAQGWRREDVELGGRENLGEFEKEEIISSEG